MKTRVRRAAAQGLSVMMAIGLSMNVMAAPPSKPSGSSTRSSSSSSSGSIRTSASSSSSSITYSGATSITSSTSQSGQTYSSSTVDESALLINTSGAVSIENPTVTKTGSSNAGDNCNFYGVNAAVLAMGGTTTTISGGTITSEASGANGVFSYGGNGGTNGAAGDGTTVNISGTTINTTGSGSGGIMTTGGGVTNATNLTVTTSGGSSAPIRTDRGGGTVNVYGGSYTSNGLGSPAIYSTADVTANDATLVSNLSEGVCIEGKNSITLTNCDLTANNTRTNGNATFLDTIMIYQSMSGDADSGTSSFTMSGGSLTSKNGHVFHVTNTTAVITLSGVTISNEDSDNVLISVCDDGWSGGSNIATLNASAQALSGAVLVGSDSTLNLSLANGSALTGAISGSITNASGTSVSSSIGTVAVTLDSTSSWTLTGDSYVTSLSGSTSNINTNGHTLYVNGTAWDGSSSSSTDSSSSSSTDSSSSSSSTGSTTTDTSSSTASTTTDSSSTTTASTSSAADSTAESITVSRRPSFKSVKAAKNKITVKWKAIKKNKAGKALLKTIRGIQVQYSTTPTFTDSTTVTRALKKTKTSLTVKGLKRKTNYYVRVRYVGINGVSQWSKIRRIRTK